MSLFSDKSGQVETFLCLCPTPLHPTPCCFTPHHPETGSEKLSHAPPFFITQYYRCLKSCCQATKCFGAVLLFWPFSSVSVPHPHPFAHACTHPHAHIHTHSGIPGITSLKCIQDLPWIITRPLIPPNFSFSCFPPSAKQIITDSNCLSLHPSIL